MSIEYRGKRYPNKMLDQQSPCDKCNMKGSCHPENCLIKVRWDAHEGIRKQYYGE